MVESVLQASNLSVVLERKQILTHIGFTLKTHERLVILGPNGAGKSTLAKTLNGFYPYEGSITLFAEELRGMDSKARARKITYIPPTLELFDEAVTLHAFLLLGRYAHKRRFEPTTPEEHARACALLETFGLEQARDQPLANLSSGEKHLAMLAQALMQDAEILLFDEPTSNLDLPHSIAIFQRIQALSTQKCVIVITHDLNFALHLGGLLLCLESGAVTFYGPSSDYFTPEMLVRQYGEAICITQEGVLPRYGK